MIIDTEKLKDSIAKLFNDKINGISNMDNLRDSMKKNLISTQQNHKANAIQEVEYFERFIKQIQTDSNNEIQIT